MAAVHAVLKGESYLSPAITGLVVAQYVDLLKRTPAADGQGEITEKEKRYVQLVGEGCDREEIAAQLAMDEVGVKELELAVLERFQLSGPVELVEYAGAHRWFAGQEGIDAAVQQAATSGQERARQPRPKPLAEPLTNRELEVLELLGRRLSDKEIADELSVSVPTVKTHVSHILQKLGAENRRVAAGEARALGLIA